MLWYTRLQNLDEYVPWWLPFVIACVLFYFTAKDCVVYRRGK